MKQTAKLIEVDLQDFDKALADSNNVCTYDWDDKGLRLHSLGKLREALFLPPNAPMSGAEARSAEASAPLAC